MKQRGDRSTPEAIFAYELSGRHIGELIRFRVTSEQRQTVSIVTGELRQLSANGEEVYLTIGYGAEQEHTQEHAARVILRPMEDYSDVSELLGYDPEYAQWEKR